MSRTDYGCLPTHLENPRILTIASAQTIVHR